MTFCFGFRPLEAASTHLISMLGGSEFRLRNSTLRSEFTPHSRRGPEGPFSAGPNIDFNLSLQLVASDISLATSFFISLQSSSRAHSAAPRFQPRPAYTGFTVGGRIIQTGNVLGFITSIENTVRKGTRAELFLPLSFLCP